MVSVMDLSLSLAHTQTVSIFITCGNPVRPVESQNGGRSGRTFPNIYSPVADITTSIHIPERGHSFVSVSTKV